MKVKFWGARGSIPTPLTREKLRSRIAAILQRATPADLRSPETREAFLARLPDYLFNLVGGNTTCVEILSDSGERIIVDAGSGIRELGYDLARDRKPTSLFHILFTHFHYDHLQGLPFFDPMLKPENTIVFYSPAAKLESYIREHLRFPYFPVEMQVFPAKVRFEVLRSPRFRLCGMAISWRQMKHPGQSYSYRFSNGRSSIIFATDSEITETEFADNEENRSYFEGADILILDSQYTLQESLNKIDWGHTSYSLAVDLAARWHIGTLVLFHHEPSYSDKKVQGMLRSAQWYLQHLENSSTRILLATEGLELSV
jgi:phosphoribosyl 1,2-cyclic phosphodiesterase